MSATKTDEQYRKEYVREDGFRFWSTVYEQSLQGFLFQKQTILDALKMAKSVADEAHDDWWAKRREVEESKD